MYDQDTTRLLHSFQTTETGSKLTGIAWNHASDTLMFATASDNGDVRIWTERPTSLTATTSTHPPELDDVLPISEQHPVVDVDKHGKAPNDQGLDTAHT